MKTRKKQFNLLCIYALLLLLLPSVYARADSGESFDEGVDTRVEITGFSPYGGDPAFSFLSEGDRIAVLSPSALPDRGRIETTLAGLRGWGSDGRSPIRRSRRSSACAAVTERRRSSTRSRPS